MTDQPLQEAAESLRTTVWTTQGARFEAQRRLLQMHKASLWSISLLSVYVIGISLVSHFIELPGNQAELLDFVAVISAVFIIALSLLEAGRSYEVRAERLHESGLALGKLCGRLDIFLATDCDGGTPELVALRAAYDGVLRDFKENHSPVDYQRFRASKSEFGLKLWHKLEADLNWWWKVYAPYTAVLILPLILTAIFLS